MIKTYKSKNTVPHFSVGRTRVAFHATSMGHSYFTTEDEELQRGIERHPWFGKKFTVDSVEGTAENTSGSNVDKAETTTVELKEMHFSTLADAKNYLAAEFGAMRSNIKTFDNAVSIGKANGVKIVFDK